MARLKGDQTNILLRCGLSCLVFKIKIKRFAFKSQIDYQRLAVQEKPTNCASQVAPDTAVNKQKIMRIS